MIPGMTAPLQGPVTMNVPFAPESAARVRAALESWLEHRGSDAEIVDDVRLIATELVGNAVRHASPLNNGTVLVRWREEDATLVLSVADGGGPTRPQRAQPTLAGVLQVGGHRRPRRVGVPGFDRRDHGDVLTLRGGEVIGGAGRALVVDPQLRGPAGQRSGDGGVVRCLPQGVVPGRVRLVRRPLVPGFSQGARLGVCGVLEPVDQRVGPRRGGRRGGRRPGRRGGVWTHWCMVVPGGTKWPSGRKEKWPFPLGHSRA